MKTLKIQIIGEIGSGKSTIARLISDELHKLNIKHEILDQDYKLGGIVYTYTEAYQNNLSNLSEMTNKDKLKIEIDTIQLRRR